VNPQFNLFAIDNIDFENFPPVENKYGTATVKGGFCFAVFKIRNLETNSPLMAFLENKAGVQLFFGRKQLEMELQSHVKNQSFDKFDVFYRQYSFGIQ
jgi:hypothetical protein